MSAPIMAGMSVWFSQVYVRVLFKFSEIVQAVFAEDEPGSYLALGYPEGSISGLAVSHSPETAAVLCVMSCLVTAAFSAVWFAYVRGRRCVVRRRCRYDDMPVPIPRIFKVTSGADVKVHHRRNCHTIRDLPETRLNRHEVCSFCYKDTKKAMEDCVINMIMQV